MSRWRGSTDAPRGGETAPKDGVRHRQEAKAAGKQLLPEPKGVPKG